MHVKTRLLICMESLAMNGVLRSLLNLLEALPTERYDVDLLVLNPEIPSWVKIPEYVRIRRAPLAYNVYSMYSRNAFKLCLKEWRFDLLLRRAIAKNGLIANGPKIDGEWDVAIAYSMGTLGDIVVDKVTAQKKILWTHTDPRAEDFRSLFAHYRTLIPKVSAFVCVSEGIAEALKTEYPQIAERISCVHNVVDEEAIKAKARAGEVQGKSDDVIRLMTVGRFSPTKNQAMVPRIASCLRKAGVSVEWYLIGPGAAAAKLGAQAELTDLGVADRIHYCETMLNPYAMMSSADIYVQPSSYEGWGLTVTEALVLGCYVIGSNIPSFRDQVKDDAFGRLVPLTEEDFANAIETVIREKRYQRESRKSYPVPWTAESTLREFEKVLNP